MYAQRKKVNRFNENIKDLLVVKKKSVASLASHLNYDVTTVQDQLRSEETFSFPDLVRICTFLDQLPADFFYERLPEDLSTLKNELKGDSRLVNLRIRETGRQVVRYFERRVIYN